MPMFSVPDLVRILVVFAACEAQVAAQATVTSTQKIPLPTARPDRAFNVPADFPSVGFESGTAPGYDDPFSDTMISNLAARMDAKPVIRVGGTSGDIIKYDPSLTEPVICLNNTDIYRCGSKSSFITGPHYFDAFKNRFQGAKISIQAPLDPIHKDNERPNKTNVVDFIKEAYNAVGKARIDAVALGNEVNFYETDAADYVKDALAAADDIKGAVDVGDGLVWEILDEASGSDHWKGGKPYTVKDVFDAGINKDQKVKYVAEHYYQFDGDTAGIETHLLNHTELVAKFARHRPSVDYALNTAKTGYILSETGGPLGAHVEASTLFAQSLWAVNFMMYTMSNGVQRVSLVQEPQANRSLWTPSGLSKLDPKVKAPYYAMPFITDFIGKQVQGNRGAVEINITTPYVTAYAMYEGNNVARVGIVNLRNYDGKGDRSGVKVSLENLGSVPNNKIQVGRLHANEGTAAGGFDVNNKNITWSGQAWSYKVNVGKGHGNLTRNEIDVKDGKADVVIPDSEAIIVYLK